MTDKPIFVTKPDLPPLEELIPYFEKIWSNKILTNGGPFHTQLEAELCDYLQVEYLSLFANGTLALLTALQSLELKGEVITTPYSFVATTHAIDWNKLAPVFVDIDPITLNLDASRIEAAITPRTSAILPVHCYGNPCDVQEIQEIANKHGLKVIYDAAHAFGVMDTGGSILRHGDLSVLSFHATKVFNTFEGGAIICHDSETKARIDSLKNFGIADEISVTAAGINGKMNELCAAVGLLQLKYVNDAIAHRRMIDELYRNLLSGVEGIRCLEIRNQTSANYSYFPILVDDSYPISRDALYERLKSSNINSRRYFYPLISDCQVYRELPSAEAKNLPIASKIAEQVLCMPIYSTMLATECEQVAKVIREI